VVRRERPRGRAAVQRLEHRRLHLEKAPRVEERADRARHPRARHEQPPHLGVHGEIGVALAVALLRIGEAGVADELPVHHLLLAERQRPQRLREELHRFGANRDLARARPEERSADADDVADVEQVEQREAVVAEHVAPEIQLEAALLVGEVSERRLAVPALRDEPPRDAHGRSLLVPRAIAEGGERLRRRVRAVEGVGERRDAARLERRQLLAPRPQHEVEVVARVRRRTTVVAHAEFASVTCFRYASTNGSMSPSITRCTSGILSSVRWSFTIVYGWKT
jgi:hypothetical protein